jgi:hypothetical protein
MKPTIHWEFHKIKDPVNGGGFGNYYTWYTQSYGRELLKDVIQLDSSEFPEDPWGPGQEDL